MKTRNFYFYWKGHIDQLSCLALEPKLPILNEKNVVEPDIWSPFLVRDYTNVKFASGDDWRACIHIKWVSICLFYVYFFIHTSFIYLRPFKFSFLGKFSQVSRLLNINVFDGQIFTFWYGLNSVVPSLSAKATIGCQCNLGPHYFKLDTTYNNQNWCVGGESKLLRFLISDIMWSQNLR